MPFSFLSKQVSNERLSFLAASTQIGAQGDKQGTGVLGQLLLEEGRQTFSVKIQRVNTNLMLADRTVSVATMPLWHESTHT